MNETIPALVALREKGLVRHIGITGLPLKIFRTVLDRCEPQKNRPAGDSNRSIVCEPGKHFRSPNLAACACGCRSTAATCTDVTSSTLFCIFRSAPAGSVDFILSYCHHALNDRSLRELLPYLQEKGIAVVNGSVLGMGLLTNKVQRALENHRYNNHNLSVLLKPPVCGDSGDASEWLAWKRMRGRADAADLATESQESCASLLCRKPCLLAADEAQLCAPWYRHWLNPMLVIPSAGPPGLAPGAQGGQVCGSKSGNIRQ